MKGKASLILLMLFVSNTHSQNDCVSRIYYTSERAPVAETATHCPEDPVYRDAARTLEVSGTGVVAYLDENFISGGSRNVSYYNGRGLKVGCTVSGSPSTVELSGHQLLVMDEVIASRSQGIIIAPEGRIGSLRSDNLFEVKRETARALSTALKNGSGVNISPSFADVSFPAVPAYFEVVGEGLFPSQAGRSRRGGLVVTSGSLREEIRKVFSRNGWENFEIGFVQKDGKWHPAIIKQFGEEKTAYAPYGRFTSLEEAKKYGYTTSDKLYYSKQQLVKGDDPTIFPEGMRYGSAIYLEGDLEGPRSKEVMEDIPWQDECRTSAMEYIGDDFNRPLPSRGGKAEADGFITPLAPDDFNNTNPVPLRECPDNFFYWSLYQNCVKALFAEDRDLPDARIRVNYEDYLKEAMTDDPSWRAFNEDMTTYDSDVDKGVFPETPAYYNRKGDRLNPNSTELVYDPFHPETEFYGRDEVWEWGLTLTAGKWVKKNRDVTKFMSPRLSAMKGFFENVIRGNKSGLLSFFGLDPNYHEENLVFSEEYGPLTVTMQVGDRDYFKLDWTVLNPGDKYLEYRDPTTFIVSSTTGVPYKLRNQVRKRDLIEVTFEDYTKFLNWYVFWTYDIFSRDRYGDIYRIGTLHIESLLYRNDIDGPSISWEHTDHVYTKGPNEALLPGYDKYDLNSRSARTDLKDLSERDDLTFEEKMEAITNIALHIAVSEGLDMAMKWIHKNQTSFYILAKKAENWTAVMITAQIARVVYKSYREWALMMDILKDVRDTYKEMENAYSRIKRASGLMASHFINLDYKKIRPTNITMIYPKRAVNYFDYAAWDMKGSLLRFERSLHALAFNSDRFTAGPGKLVLGYIHKGLFDNLGRVNFENDARREKTHEELREASSGVGDSPSDHIRLSRYTKLAIDRTRALEVKSLASSTEGLLSVLVAIQSDSRDWVTMGDYVTGNLAGGPGAFMESRRDRTPEAIYKQFDVPMIFHNRWVDEKVNELEAVQ